MRKVLLLVVIGVALAAGALGCAGGGGAPAPTSTPEAKRIQEIGGKQWTQVKTDSPLEIVDHKLFFTGLGETAFVIGELENKGSGPVTDVKISFKGYAAEGKLLDTREGDAPVAFIAAGAKAPFKIAVDLREVAKYELAVESKPAESVPENKLVVSDAEMGAPKSGYVWVTGKVTNNGSETVQSVEMITVLRDASGAVVEVDAQKLTDPLEAGKTASFKFMVMSRDATKLEVTAQPARD